MLYFTNEKKYCTGCSACYSVCPVKCITMEKDEEGFLYPIASDECIHCGKCEKICPVAEAEAMKQSFQQKAYCVLTKDKEIWKRSASGGAFSEICKAFGDNDTIISGAAWDGFNVHHICVKGTDNIAPLCKSKYISSSPENVFSEIKNYLSNEKKVVFCGTPCQVAGLKNFLGKEYENLLLIDLICHGVGSPDVFKVCMSEIGDQFGIAVNSYQFRAKRDVYQTDYLACITFNDGKRKYLVNDQYIQLFLNQNCLRPSCGENCRYRNETRQGDITIADFKGLTKVFPELSCAKRNYSSVVVNSSKGDAVIKNMLKSVKFMECELDDIKKYNPLFFRQTWFSKDRDNFFKDFLLNSKEAIKKWTTDATVNERSLKRKVYDILPVFIRRFIEKS